MRAFGIIALTVVVSLLTSTAQAGFQYGFWAITNNSNANKATGTNQLKLEAFDVGNNQVQLLFSNTGSKASSITDIYFDDGQNLLTSVASIQNSAGVIFRTGNNLPTLTGGGGVGFFTDQSLNTESTTIAFGVNPGESVGLTLQIASGHMFGEVVNSLANCNLRVGLMMQGFSGSALTESFMNASTNSSPVPVTPEPSALALGGLACVGLLWQKRKKRA